MHTVRTRRAIAIAAFTCAWLSAATVVIGQMGTAPSGAVQQTSEQAFKSVAILRGIPVDTFFDAMGMFANAMGNDCTYCHDSASAVDRTRFAVPTARINKAREMIVMMNAINKTYFKGEPRVTCFTCHAGNQSPRSDPNLALQYSTPVENPNDRDFTTDPTLKAEQILDQYIKAVGGQERLAKITTLVGKGTYIGFDTAFAEVPVEFYAKAPNQMSIVARLTRGNSVRTFDGTNAWLTGPDAPVPLLTFSAGNLDRTRLEALASFPTSLRQAFSQWRVGRAVLNDNEVKILQASEGGQPVANLYFNETGLLVRLVRWTLTPVGFVPTQVDFDDYREVAGVRMPFKRQVTQTYMQMTIQLSELQANANVDANRFARPTPARTGG